MIVTKRLQDVYRSELNRLSNEASSYVESYINALHTAVPDASVSELREATKEAIDNALNAFGTQAGQLSTELFEEIMRREGRDITGEIYDTIDRTDVDKKVRYFAGKLVEGNLPSFTKNVKDLTRYYVKRTAFENSIQNCIKHEVRYARVPSGRETCAFCFMLSSRGFIYYTELTATGKDGHGMHRHCDCIIVPGRVDAKGNALTSIEGYNPKAMYDRWKQCAHTVGVNAEDSSYQNRQKIIDEVAKRDWKWLYSEKKPKIEFANKSIRKDKLKNHSDEIETAIILRKNGIKSLFITDEESYFDKEKGQMQRKGYPDLANGIEIKCLDGASSYNTINGHIKNTSNKEGAKILVFNNSKNEEMDDEDLITHINRSRRFKRGRIYIIDHNEKYKFVR